MPVLRSMPPILLDRRRLGLSIWTFALRSLSKRYGHVFVRRVLLRYPHRVLQGLLAYTRFLAQDLRRSELIPIGVADAQRLWMRAAEAGPRFLVGLGFCQKPGANQDWRLACPAGRFNHDCPYLEHLDADRPGDGLSHSACQQCAIRTIGTAALHAGASLYIMTTALEIAQDLLLPALMHKRFRVALLALCPYSVEPMALSLLISRVQAGMATYDRGACQDYDQWLRADQGNKPDRTSLPSEVLGKLLEGLEWMAEDQRGGSHFRRQGNVYVPSV